MFPLASKAASVFGKDSQLAAIQGRIGTDTPQDGDALSARDVSFRYEDGTVALSDLSLSVRRGTTVGIVGPSGCGKTTLLALLAGFYQPTSGTISVGQGAADRHPVGMVFQKDTLLPWLTAADNIKLYHRWNRGRLGKSEVETLVRELIELAGLDGFEKAYPYQLSGGMRRRVCFLTAVAARPEVLLLDEPFSALDEPTRIAIHQDASAIIREFGMTTVLVTHDLAEAISLCDEVLILTARPGTVHGKYEIPFGEARNMLELRQTPEFLATYGELWQQLAVQIERSRARSDRTRAASDQSTGAALPPAIDRRQAHPDDRETE